MMTRYDGGVPAAQSWSRYDAAQHDVGGMMTSSCWEDDDGFVDYVNGFVVVNGIVDFVDYVNAMEVCRFVHRLFEYKQRLI